MKKTIQINAWYTLLNEACTTNCGFLHCLPSGTQVKVLKHSATKMLVTEKDEGGAVYFPNENIEHKLQFRGFQKQ